MSGLFFNIDVKDNNVSEILNEVSLKIQHPRAMLNDIAELSYDAIADAFQAERTPEGIPWDDLAESTIKQRTSRGLTPIRKLRATGRGERGISIDIKGDNVQISYGKNSTEYMKYHRTGTKKMSKRDFLPTVEWFERNREITKAIEKQINSLFRLR